MKLLINQDMKWDSSRGSLDSNVDIQESFNSMQEFFKKFSVHNTNKIVNGTITIHIHAQKVTLDEQDMNELFSDFFSQFFEFKIKYANLGGAGCDFAMEIVESSPL